MKDLHKHFGLDKKTAKPGQLTEAYNHRKAVYASRRKTEKSLTQQPLTKKSLGKLGLI